MTTETMSDTGLETAVVGMAGRFPGASSVDEFWESVAEGRETVSRLTPEELTAAGVPDELWQRPDYVPAYGVVDDVERFDAGFFGYTPRDASLIDPQQRLFLECAWEALEGAGHLVPGEGELVGVYAGTNLSSYLLRHLIGNPDVLAGVTEYELFLGNDKDSLATRVAYHLDLRGPAVSVQTACSSSLVAIHQACQALLAHECDVALAGGANVRLPMRSGYRYEPGGIMSQDGRCYAFDARATGTVGGNGAAAVVLRRLADAVRDGDTIYAVVKGSAINNDGRLKVGYTAPSTDGQAAVIRMAQDAAGVEPDTIAYVETHGTGTSLGDQIEFQALVQAFRAGTDRKGFCALGAVKALVGHLDAAAGVTGFIKAALALRDGLIPPNPYFRDPHPDLDLATSPFYVNSAPLPWPESHGPRRAGVSSFGIGGTNAHVILEEPPAPHVQPSGRGNHLLVLSARTAPALAQMRQRLAAHLMQDRDVPLADIAYTLQSTRRAMPHRLAVVSDDRDAAIAALSEDGAAGVRTAVQESTHRTVAFLFPGQGAQHVNMARDLHRAQPTFRRWFDECADVLRARLDLNLHEVVYPAAAGEQAAARLRQTALTQPALFAVEYALAQLWAEWGVRPAAMAGHSIGEYVAACLAGVFTLEEALVAVATRGRLMQDLPGGAMLAVHLPAEQVEPMLPDGVTLAAVNAPRLSVVAGEDRALESLAQTLRGRAIECRPLHTSHAFHSPHMDSVLAPFSAHLRQLTLRPPRIPVVSNVTGDWLTAEQATDPEYWARHLREPVRFNDCAALLLGQRHALLEVGPGTSLATLVRQHQATGERTVVSSLSHPGRPQPDAAAIARALGQLWLGGVHVDWSGVWTHEQRRRRPLPTYPFQRDRHWIDAPGTVSPVMAAAVTSAAADGSSTAGVGSGEPAVDGGAVPAAGGGESPTTSMQETIRRIWVELLGVPSVGPHDDFFELGGHSLVGTQVIARIRDALAVDLPPSALFESPTIAGLAATAEHLRAADGAGEGDLMPDLLAEIMAMSPGELREQLAREQEGAAAGDARHSERPSRVTTTTHSA